MYTIGLASYTIQVREKHKKEPLLLGHLEMGHRFLEEFRVFASGLQRELRRDDETRNLLRITQLNEETPGVVWGMVEAGGWGRRHDIVHSKTLARAREVTADEAVMHPFYFMLDAPDDSNRAIYILQRLGNTGVHQRFTTGFRKFFAERNPHLIFDVSRQIPREVLRYLVDGQLKRIQLRSYMVPRIIEEKTGLRANPDEPVVVTTTVRAKGRGAALTKPNWINAVIGGPAVATELLEAAPVEQIETDDVTLTFSYNGKERSLNLAKPDTLVPYVDITEDVEPFGDDGHPTPERLHAAASSLRDDILTQMGRI